MRGTGQSATIVSRSFSLFPLVDLVDRSPVDIRHDPFPTTLSAWGEQRLVMAGGATHFGFVYKGTPRLTAASGSFTLSPGMYFSVPGSGSVSGPGQGIVVSRWDFLGFFHLGGPVEEKGRLEYIDGCTDSLLIPPVIKGDPCLNLLHVPPRTDQTRHAHPSLRVGLIVRGEGTGVTPSQTFSLSPGMVFVIPAGSRHSFHTERLSLLIVAYHPDSDYGPTSADHPMINRTVVT